MVWLHDAGDSRECIHAVSLATGTSCSSPHRYLTCSCCCVQAQLEGKSWDKLTKMAKGERILDNPALLKRSIKRDAKHKEKKSELWKNRVNDQKQKMAQVQKKCVSCLSLSRRQVFCKAIAMQCSSCVMIGSTLCMSIVTCIRLLQCCVAL